MDEKKKLVYVNDQVFFHIKSGWSKIFFISLVTYLTQFIGGRWKLKERWKNAREHELPIGKTGQSPKMETIQHLL